MKRLVLFLLAVVSTEGLMAATPSLPPLDPRPVVRPALPGADSMRVDPNEALMKKIHSRMRWIDGRIEALIRQNDGLTPAMPIPARPELQEVRNERDEAWTNLQAVLAEPGQIIAGRVPDVTDLAPKQNADEVLQDLAAQNRFTMAMCSKEAFERDGRRNVEYLKKGLVYIEGINEAHLPSGYRTQLRYYQIWFVAEKIRLLPAGAEYEAHKALLQRLAKQFQNEHGQSDLMENVTWLLDMLQLDNNVEATRERLKEETGPDGIGQDNES